MIMQENVHFLQSNVEAFTDEGCPGFALKSFGKRKIDEKRGRKEREGEDGRILIIVESSNGGGGVPHTILLWHILESLIWWSNVITTSWEIRSVVLSRSLRGRCENPRNSDFPTEGLQRSSFTQQ